MVWIIHGPHQACDGSVEVSFQPPPEEIAPTSIHDTTDLGDVNTQVGEPELIDSLREATAESQLVPIESDEPPAPEADTASGNASAFNLLEMPGPGSLRRLPPSRRRRSQTTTSRPSSTTC